MTKQIAEKLESKNIYDFYFANGKMFFLNEWDEDSIRRLMKDIAPEFDQADIQLDGPEINY